MSTIKTTYIQHPSATSPNLELAADGTVVLPLSDLEDLANVSGSPTDGQVLAYDNGTSTWNPTDQLAGIGSNVVQTVLTDTFSASVAAGANVSGDAIAATITPTSDTAKVLVIVQFSGSLNSNSQNLHGLLYKNGSVTAYIGDTASSRQRITVVVNTRSEAGSGVIVYLDSPATTSATTYSLRLAHDSGSTQTVFLNRSNTDTDNAFFARAASSITLIEVAP